MIRVLQVVGVMTSGGMETFIMNVYRKIDRTKVQFDFIVHGEERHFYDDEIEQLGGRIYRVTRNRDSLIRNFMDIKKVVKENHYSVVHRHSPSAIVLFELLAAKAGGANNLIIHSHSTKTRTGRRIHKLLIPFMNRLCIRHYACSKDAGKWMFGNKQPFVVLNNGVASEKFRYNEEIRAMVREELELGDNFTIIHVGRFSKEKNHIFLIQIFKEIVKQNPCAKLLLVGTGPLENEVKETVQNSGLEDNVIFLGVRNDVNRLLQAADVFVFPSLFEGLPVTVVEAQCSGIKVVMSDTITTDTVLTDTVVYKSLGDTPENWAKTILDTNGYEREDKSEIIKEKMFDIQAVADYLQNEYIQLSSKR